MTKSLNKVLELINKTGDRCIILPETGDEAYAVMSLPEYERLALRKSEVAALTEDELLDKINRDIAVWKSRQEVENEVDVEEKATDWGTWDESLDDDFEDEDEEMTEDPYYFESIDR
ncbi:MAG: hypothetical protein A3H70_04515 [Candidatus Komeilibacteria bacterium RIFCSPLOWO2_02_FULL_48_11]|uniref:Antitoxin n=1 Tax=Candidatus Komeilibacteria bacterium RIFCSPLOWO2_02_FULL_48_11 TaxID=1798553 RepID=A0A1G2BVU2_9BACT|nr:MAG: hypothetical protein A3H70_04515 [Candidatus Komeilibacteria bacterium RIFCSPLOWO2_02_FULL_48_11]